MSYIIDIVLLAVFILIVVLAAKKGFAKTLLDFVAMILAVVLAYSFAPMVSEFVYDNIVKDKIIESVEKQLDGKELDAVGTAESVKNIINELPEPVVRISNSLGIDVEKISNKIDLDKISQDVTVEGLTEKVAKPIILPALNLLSFALLAVLLMIILKFIASLLSKVFKLPLVGAVNTTLGGVFGALKGAIIVAIAVVTLKSLFGGMDNTIGQMVDSSIAVKEISNLLISLK